MKRCFCIVLLFFFTNMTCFGQGGWVWAKRGIGQGVASSAASIGVSTATDNAGNVFVTGPYSGNYIVLDTIKLVYDGYSNFFVAKYDSSGNILWAKTFGGHYSDKSHRIITDSKGNIIVTGQFESSSINFGNTTLNGISTYPMYSSAEFFIAKLDTDGNVLWAKGAQGNHQDAGDDLAIDINGNIYVSGSFQSSTLTFDNITISANKNTNGDYLPSAFIARYDESGNLIWVKTCDSSLGSGGYNSMFGYGNYIATDLKGQIYLTGRIVITNNSDQLTEKAYLAKFDSDGKLLWSKIFEGSGFGNYSYSSGIVIDKLDQVYITGSFYYTLLIGRTTLVNINTYGNLPSVFVARFDTEGNSIWAKSVTHGSSTSSGITATRSGNVFITGNLSLYGNNNDTIVFGGINLVSTIRDIARENAFLAQYDSAGTALWATFIDSKNQSWGRDVTTDVHGNVLVSGLITSSYDYRGGPVSFGDIPIPPWNYSGMFIAKLKPCSKPFTLAHVAAICAGDSITVKSPSLTKNVWNTGAVSPSIIVKTAGDYMVTISNSSSCSLQIETTTVIINYLPQASIAVSAEILCENENVTITSNEAVTYLWNTGATSQSISVTDAGAYHVTITDTNGCSATSKNVELKYIEPLPDVALISDCNKIFINQDFYVNWFHNNEYIKLDSTLKEFYPTDSGYYHIEISNQCGIKKSNIIHFKPSDPHFITLPNVITPNGDDYNEFFVLDEKLSGSALQIINRWGQEVFSSEEYENNWNGDDLSSGMYYYIISNSCFIEKLKGVLSLIR